MFLQLDRRGALNRQLYRALRQAIESGALKPGDRVMPTRTLQQRLGLSRNVILMAYSQLQAEGYLTSRQGSGTFVAGSADSKSTAPLRRAPRGGAGASSRVAKRLLSLPAFDFEFPALPKNHFDFRYGQNPLPGKTLAEWSRIERRTWRSAFESAELSGLPELRRAIAGHLRQHRGLTVAVDDILVTSGARETIDLTMRLCVDPGATVVVEDPHYLPVGLLAKAHGADLHYVPVDGSGIDTRRLPGDAALVHVTPSHQYPTGAVLSVDRRRSLLQWAAASGAYIVEDDYDSQYRYDAQPLPPLKTLDMQDRVIYAGSFSKVLSSAVRIGFIVPPPALLPAVKHLKSLMVGCTSTRMQSTLAAFIQEGLLARHLRRMRRIYAERRALLLDSVDRHLGGTVEISGAAAGLHVLAHIGGWSARDGSRFMIAAAERRVGIFAATHLYSTPPTHLPALLAFGGIDAHRIDQGVRALAAVIREGPRRASVK